MFRKCLKTTASHTILNSTTKPSSKPLARRNSLSRNSQKRNIPIQTLPIFRQEPPSAQNTNPLSPQCYSRYAGRGCRRMHRAHGDTHQPSARGRLARDNLLTVARPGAHRGHVRARARCSTDMTYAHARADKSAIEPARGARPAINTTRCTACAAIPWRRQDPWCECAAAAPSASTLRHRRRRDRRTRARTYTLPRW